MTSLLSLPCNASRFIRACGLLALLWLGAVSLAMANNQALPDLPSRSTVQTQLDRLNKADKLTTADQAKRQPGIGRPHPRSPGGPTGSSRRCSR